MPNNGYFRFPSIKNEKIVFVSDDDLWEVSTKGGVARRLTSNLGDVSRPTISPDGKYLAFTGVDEGHTEVYVMPSEGGRAKRITYLGSNCMTIGWTEDSKSIIFANNVGSPFLKYFRIYSVSVDGGQPEMLPTGPAMTISYGNKNKAVIGRNSVDAAKWKRYRGGTAGDIWIDTKGKGNFHRFITLKGNLTNPMWIGERIYFISDHEGYGNIYSANLDGEDLTRHTNHDDFFARNPSTDGNTIVYQAGGKIFTLDIVEDKSQEIEIELNSPQVQLNRKFVNPSQFLEDYSLHPKGHSVALTIRGKAITMANWEGPVSQHGTRNGVRYRLCRWLNDGERIVATSDEKGDERLVIFTVDGTKDVVKLDKIDIGLPLLMKISPKEDKVALSNNRHDVMIIDLKAKKRMYIERSEHGRIESIAWSPDGRWIAYDFPETPNTSCIKICNVKTGETHKVTTSDFTSYSPSFDPEGKFLYFLSNRELNPVYDTIYFDLNFPRSSKPYLITLQKDTPSPFIPVPRPPEAQSMLEKMQAKKAHEEQAESTKVEIDFDGIQNRILSFPVPIGNYGQIWGIIDKALFTNYPIQGSLEDENVESGSKGTLLAYDFEDYKTEDLINGVSSFKVSRDRKTLMYRTGRKLRAVRAGESAKESRKNLTPKEAGWIALNRVKVSVNPIQEWEQMFSEAWRLQRDHYWTEDMAQIDWKKVHKRYFPLVSTVSTRSEFSDIMWEVAGELGTSHAYEMGGDYRAFPRYSVGKLGADLNFDNKKNAWVVTHIPEGDCWDANSSSPLSQPGININVGDQIVKVDGIEVGKDVSPNEMLVNHAGGEIVLTVKSGRKVRNVTITTLRSETALRYREWVENNRKYVHKKTKGKVGYVHVPNMGPDGFAEFHRYYLTEVEKESLIVDVRFNGGGHVSQLLLEKLARKRLGYDSQRWAKAVTYPSHTVLGSIVALTNENAGSDGDIFSHCFKLMGLGTLIGTRTWGGVIGIWPRHGLVDGTVTTQPEFSFWFKDVHWGVENYGTDPDIVVDIAPQDYVKGNDPQLDKGIEEVLKSMKSPDYNPLRPDFTPRPILAAPKLPKNKK